MRQSMRLLILAGTAGLFFSGTLLSQGPPGQPPPPGGPQQLLILGAETDFALGELIISGKNFGDQSQFSGTVSLFTPQGTVPLQVFSFDPTQQKIVAELPTNIGATPGTFLLTVSTGHSQIDTFGVTIGAVGPEGPQGPAVAIRDSSRDLVIKNSDATPASVIDATAAEVILQNGSGNAIRVAAVALSIDADASGPNGVDTGIREPDNWYHIWIIFDAASNNAAGLLSLDPDYPVLPAGYDYKARVGAIRTDSVNGDLIRIHQVGHRVVREPGLAIQETYQVFLKPVSIASLVPPTAKKVSGYWDSAVYANVSYGLVAATPQGLGSVAFGYVFSPDGNLNMFESFELAIAVPQTFYLTVYGGVAYLLISGWEF